MLGVSGILADGTLVVKCDEEQEIAFVLGSSEKLATLGSNVPTETEPGVANVVRKTALMRLANDAGFKLEVTEIDTEGHIKYTFTLENK